MSGKQGRNKPFLLFSLFGSKKAGKKVGKECGRNNICFKIFTLAKKPLKKLTLGKSFKTF